MNPSLNVERWIQKSEKEGEVLFYGVSLRLSAVLTFLRIRKENKWKATMSCCRLFRNRALWAYYPRLKAIWHSQRQVILQRAIDDAVVASEQTSHSYMDVGNGLPVSFVIEMLVSQRDNTTMMISKCANFYLTTVLQTYYPNKTFVEYVPKSILKETTEAAIDLAINDSLARIDRTCVSTKSVRRE